MPMLEFGYLASMRDVAATAWHALAPGHLFTLYAWLSALEESGMITAERGLRLRCPVLYDSQGNLMAAAPGLVKENTSGECGPENLWIEIAAKNGRRLLPKVHLGLPDDPSVGPRQLTHPAHPRVPLAATLVDVLVKTSMAEGFRAVTVARMWPEDAASLQSAGMVMSQEVGCYWKNEGYAGILDFLDRLKKSYRYEIVRDRSTLQAAGLEVRWLRGAEILPGHWEAFHAGYVQVCARYGSQVRLTRPFYDHLAAFGDAVTLVGAFAGDEFVAGVYCLRDGDTLYSRHWSALREVPCGVLELGFYQPMEIAIADGLRYLDCGIWGPHKTKRGFRSVLWPSAHGFVNPSMRLLAEDYARRHLEVCQRSQAQTWESRYFRDGGSRKS
jgi:predicted N-acyltransferase